MVRKEAGSTQRGWACSDHNLRYNAEGGGGVGARKGSSLARNSASSLWSKKRKELGYKWHMGVSDFTRW